MKSSGEAFYALARDGSATLCNNAFLRLLGFEREDHAYAVAILHVFSQAVAAAKRVSRAKRAAKA